MWHRDVRRAEDLAVGGVHRKTGSGEDADDLV